MGIRFPARNWVRGYDREAFTADIIAAAIVSIMLIPQSLAYALLAGLPAEVGLYASILPLIAYALLGTSSTLSVGPVAITSLLTASALAAITEAGSTDYLAGAIMLAALSGLMLLAFGLLRLGFVANFLSHSVVSAFISASALIIALSQLKHLLGVDADGDNVLAMAHDLLGSLGVIHGPTLVLGALALALLLGMRSFGARLWEKLGLKQHSARLVNRSAPVLIVLITLGLVWALSLDAAGVAVVGTIPRGLPLPTLPSFDLELIRQLIIPALLISIIGYVESISVGRTLAAKRRERIDSNQELVGLGAANLASAVSGALPVTGGFSRSVVNFDAGARTQAASIYAALLIALATVLLTPALYYLPNATLAATIIVAVLSLVDFSVFAKTLRFSRSDFSAVMLTFFMTLGFGVEVGVSAGVLVSLLLYLYRTSRPHIAEVGQVAGTEHFRNVKRYRVILYPEILTLRVDETLFFANANYLEEMVYDRVFQDDRIAHVILMFSAINELDFSALEVMETLNARLFEQGILLHISELKGPVQDRLEAVHFLEELTGQVYLTQYQAIRDLAGRHGYEAIS